MTTVAEAAPSAAASRHRVRQWLAHPRVPLILLLILCVPAVGVRVYRLTTPVAKPPTQGYIFDERYYVSAAGVIAGKPVKHGNVYFGAAPSGADPNGEHPQLGKLTIAGSIEIFGDNAIGWRISAVAFGLAAILLLYWLVRCAGGSSWLALSAACLASFDNLWLVHSRIAVLDIYAVPFMLAATALYLRRHPLWAGLLIGIGCCMKEFAAYTVLVLLLIELMRTAASFIHREPGPKVSPLTRAFAVARRPRRAVAVGLLAGLTYFSLLSGLDTLVTPYSGGHPVDRGQASICKYVLIWKDGCNHFAFMNRFAGELRDNGSPKGIATTPVDFWINRKVIGYYATTRTVSVNGVAKSTQRILWFRGEISRVLLLTSWLALIACLWWAIRRRDDLSFLVLAWALGTWLPPELFHAIDQRTTYLYYMVVTMPALYIAVARLLGLAWLPGAGRLLSVRRLPLVLVVAWTVIFLLDFANLYPFRTLTGS
jgi:4-amino-4-deoxy-L-arabinose transferase-like glycosyltransferase